MQKLLAVLTFLVILTSCANVEEKIVDETEHTLKEDFGPSPVDG